MDNALVNLGLEDAVVINVKQITGVIRTGNVIVSPLCVTNSSFSSHNLDQYKCLCFFVACKCNPEGSASLQCDQTTGHCVCLLGIGGPKCDQCARGYLGQMPSCSPCGECFDNWDLILNDLKS